MSWLSSLKDALQDRLSRPPQTEALAQGAGVVAADAAPAAAPPETIDSAAALETALAWLRWCDSRARTLAAVRDQTLALVEEGHRRELVLPALQTTLPDLSARLEAAVLAYARTHQAELFAKSQTHHCAAGAIKRTKRPASIELDGDPKEVAEHLQQQLRIPELLAELRAASPALATLVELTRIKVEPDKQAALAALKDKRLTPDDLAQAKMKPAAEGFNFRVDL